ncbi:MAG: 2-amino-4-hydroxy-6-hydroxymethyldihydropteridine diphosphokinase [Anaerolineales bacterium]
MEVLDHRVAILFGSNILPEFYLRLAVERVNQILTPIAVSSAWESAAVGSAGPNFLNTIGLYLTNFDQETLKYDVLRSIESQMGRVRQVDKFAPRTIDLDIILWDGVELESDLWRYVHVTVPFIEVMQLLNPNTALMLEEFRRRQQRQLIIRREDVLKAILTPGHPKEIAQGYIPESMSFKASWMNSATSIAPGFSPERIRNAT